MNISRPFILRPVATTLLMGALLLSGCVAYRLLPVSALPQVDYPTIHVLTSTPGASPDVMASVGHGAARAPVRPDAGPDQMSSTSSGGASVITLRFSLDKTIEVAEQEVQAAINAAGNLLPERPAAAAGLQQGQSRRHAGPDPGGHLADDAAARRSTTWRTRGWRRSCRSCPASAS